MEKKFASRQKGEASSSAPAHPLLKYAIVDWEFFLHEFSFLTNCHKSVC